MNASYSAHNRSVIAHRRPAQQPTPGFVRERIFDVARRQSARIELDRQVLERSCATRQLLPDARDERLSRVVGDTDFRTSKKDDKYGFLRRNRPQPGKVSRLFQISIAFCPGPGP